MCYLIVPLNYFGTFIDRQASKPGFLRANSGEGLYPTDPASALGDCVASTV